jgi:hypothetical protein
MVAISTATSWSVARGQDAPLRVYLAADPLPYVLHGFSAHAGVLLSGHWFSLEGAVFTAQAPDALLKLVESQDEGFTADLKGFTLEGYWHAIGDRRALLVGLQAHFDRFTVRHEAFSGEVSFDQIYLFPTIAYRFFPLERIGLFFKPLIAVGFPVLSNPSVTVGSRTFEPLSVFPLATVIVGYQF